MTEPTTRFPCPRCQTSIAPAPYCSACGAALMSSSPVTASAQPKWYYNLWFVLFMLFFVAGPLGLPLVWKNPRFSRGVKILLTAVMVVYTLFLVQLTMQAVRAAMNQVQQFNATLQ